MADVTDRTTLSLVVVDDDEEVRTALRRLLRSLGHDVRVFGSAEECEADLAAADCLIVDVRLPGLNGPELRERIRSSGADIPIVFITGDGAHASGGVTDHDSAPVIAKPFDDTELIAAIAQAISTHPY